MFLQRLTLLAVLLFVGSLSSQAQTTASSSTDYIGKWVGTFEGASSGQCELQLARDASGKLTGTVTVIPADGNRYPIDLKTVATEGNTFKAAYNDPGDGDEVTMEATRTADELKGTWSADGGAATGTWQMKRETK
jgi:hypothetical protein